MHAYATATSECECHRHKGEEGGENANPPRAFVRSAASTDRQQQQQQQQPARCRWGVGEAGTEEFDALPAAAASACGRG